MPTPEELENLQVLRKTLEESWYRAVTEEVETLYDTLIDLVDEKLRSWCDARHIQSGNKTA